MLSYLIRTLLFFDLLEDFFHKDNPVNTLGDNYLYDDYYDYDEYDESDDFDDDFDDEFDDDIDEDFDTDLNTDLDLDLNICDFLELEPF